MGGLGHWRGSVVQEHLHQLRFLLEAPWSSRGPDWFGDGWKREYGSDDWEMLVSLASETDGLVGERCRWRREEQGHGRRHQRILCRPGRRGEESHAIDQAMW